MTLLHTGKQLINEVDIIELHWAAITFLLLTATLPGGTAKWHIPLAPFLRLEALPQPLAAVLRTVPYVGADGGLSMRGVMVRVMCVGRAPRGAQEFYPSQLPISLQYTDPNCSEVSVIWC